MAQKATKLYKTKQKNLYSIDCTTGGKFFAFPYVNPSYSSQHHGLESPSPPCSFQGADAQSLIWDLQKQKHLQCFSGRLCRKFLPKPIKKRWKKSFTGAATNQLLRFPASFLKYRIHCAGTLFLWWSPGICITEELNLQKELTLQKVIICLGIAIKRQFGI